MELIISWAFCSENSSQNLFIGRSMPKTAKIGEKTHIFYSADQN